MSIEVDRGRRRKRRGSSEGTRHERWLLAWRRAPGARMIRSLLHVPVDHGLALGAVTTAAIGAIVLTLGFRARRWRSWISVLVMTLLAVVAGGKAIGIENRVGSSFPPSFYLWAALPLATLAHGVIRPGRPSRSRSLSLAAVALLLLLGAGQVNAHYSYLPTVGDVVGAPLPDQVAPGAATSLLQGPRPSTSAVGERSGRGVLLPVPIPSSSSRFEARGGYVWLPPAYFRSPRPTLPVVLMMAGVPGDPSNLLRGGHAVQVADTFAAAHDGMAPILVFPDHNGGMWTDSECVDGPRGHAETYLTVDLPAYVSHTFGTAPGGPSWAIMGYSEGGTCALILALRHPELFPSFVDIAGDLRANDRTSGEPPHHTVARLYGGRPAEWASHEPLLLLRRDPAVDATFVVGTSDKRARAAAQSLSAAATADGVPSRVVTVRGGHSFAMVSRAIATTLPMLAERLLASEGPTGARPS